MNLENKTLLSDDVVAVINLPHPESLTRRYMCTYSSPYFYFPPHDLLQVATCVREWTGARVVFLDAIAENLGKEEVIEFLQNNQPQYLITLLGVESVATDMTCASELRKAVPGLCILAFGYYATQFPKEVLQHSAIDVVLRGDPEETCCACLAAMKQGKPLEGMPGIAIRLPSGEAAATAPAHLTDLDALPFPDYSMANMDLYNEMLLGGPFAALQTSRGCPYACTYCTSPQDKRLLMRSPRAVVDEYEGLVRKGARIVRFLDDTFTFDKPRVISICREIMDRNIRAQWSCLSRVDTLDEEALRYMKQAGCVRVAVGIESYSPKVLEIFGKRIQPDSINRQLQLIRDAGLESVGFIIVGGSFETEEDFELTRHGLLLSPLDLAIIDILALYGGTPLAERFRDEIEFQLFPYVSRWRNPEIDNIAIKRERILYRQFYIRPHIVWRQMITALRFPARSFRLGWLFTRFMFFSGNHRDRHDLF